MEEVITVECVMLKLKQNMAIYALSVSCNFQKSGRFVSAKAKVLM